MDETPLVEDKAATLAAALAFQRMTDRINKNRDADFGGAVVIFPPENGGDPVDMLMFTKQAPAAFWILLKTMVEARIVELDRSNQPMGRPYGR